MWSASEYLSSILSFVVSIQFSAIPLYRYSLRLTVSAAHAWYASESRSIRSLITTSWDTR